MEVTLTDCPLATERYRQSVVARDGDIRYRKVELPVEKGYVFTKGTFIQLPSVLSLANLVRILRLRFDPILCPCSTTDEACDC